MDSNNHRRRLHRSRPEKDKEPEKEKENMGLVRRRDSFGLKGLKRSYSSSSTIASSSAYHLTRSPLHPLSFPSTSDTIPPHPTYDFTKLNARAPEDLTMHPGTKFVIPPVQDPYSDPMNDNPPSKVSSTHSKGSRESTATPKSEHPSRQFNSPPPLNIHPSSISSTVNLGSSNVNQNPLGDGKKKVSTAQRTYGSTSTTSLIPTNLLFFPDNAPAPDNGMYTSSSSTPGRKDSNTNTTPRALESINASSGRLNVFGPNSTPSGSVLTPPADSRGKWLGKVFKRCGHTKDDKKENQSGKSPPKAVIDSSPSPGYPPKIVVNSPPKESGDSLPKIAGSYFQQIKGGPLPKIKDSSLLPPKTADKLKYKANLDDLFERAVTLGIELEPNTTNRSIDPAIQPANYDPPAATLILDERSIVKLDNLPKHWEKARSEGLWERIFEFVEKKDVCSLSCASMYAKFVGESYLYNTIDLSPKLPHKFSYRNFKIAGTRLIAGNNSTKLARYCKRLIIGKGWEPNSFVLYDSSDVAYPERRFSVGDVIVTEGNVVVKDNELETWLRSEGVKKDGGLIEATSILGAIINLARNIEVFSLESAFPLSRYQISRLSNLKNMVEVKLNLRQDQRKMVREPTNLDSFIPAPAFKYRPALGRLCGPLLVVLKLYNIPTRNMEWWNEVFAAISGSSKTLRHLALEMPHPITKERYPAYFSSETSMDGDKKSPPKLTWGPTTKDQEDDFRLHLKSLLVRGMILTEDTISFEINPGMLRKVQLFGCASEGFSLSKPHSTSITFIEVDSWNFLPAVMRVASSNHGVRKHIGFIPNEPGEPFFVRALLESNKFFRGLLLSEHCSISTGAIQGLLMSSRDLEALRVHILRPQWKTFLANVHHLERIRSLKITVDDQGKPQTVGPRRRFAVDDAEDVVKAMLAGGLMLREVAVGGFEWRVDWAGPKWKLVRTNCTPADAVAMRGATAYPAGSVKVITIGRAREVGYASSGVVGHSGGESVGGGDGGGRGSGRRR